LKPDRLALPEYSRFTGMRCEIQIQTTLNHAWSETGHDILYKRPAAPGFGAKQLEAIDRRFAKIMKDYLLPAGYEFQKIKHDYERLMEGKALFDRGVIEELEDAADNNQRWDLLKKIREHMVPHYDGIAGVYPELLHALTKAITDGRATPVKAVETDFGNFRGHTADEVTDAALDILDFLRFVDVDATFEALCAIAPGAADDKEKKRVDEAVGRLSRNNLDAWRKVGPAIQTALVSTVSAFDPDERKLLFPVIVSVCRHALESEVTGTSAGLNTVTFHRGVVAVSDELVSTRKKALSVLQTLYAEAEDDERRGAVLNAILEATRTPSAGAYGNDLLKGDPRRRELDCAVLHRARCSGILRDATAHRAHVLVDASPQQDGAYRTLCGAGARHGRLECGNHPLQRHRERAPRFRRAQDAGRLRVGVPRSLAAGGRGLPRARGLPHTRYRTVRC